MLIKCNLYHQLVVKMVVTYFAIRSAFTNCRVDNIFFKGGNNNTLLNNAIRKKNNAVVTVSMRLIKYISYIQWDSYLNNEL